MPLSCMVAALSPAPSSLHAPLSLWVNPTNHAAPLPHFVPFPCRPAMHNSSSGPPSCLTSIVEVRENDPDQAVRHLDTTEESFGPNALVDLLHDCKDWAAARHTYHIVVESGYDSDTYVGTNLIQMFIRLNSLSDACRTFNKVQEPNVFTWTAIISAHTKLGQEKQGIKLYHRMRECGIEPDGHAFVAVLDACSGIVAIEEGVQVHDYIVECGLESNTYVGNALVTMYAKCGSLEEASTALSRVPMQDVVTWSALIGGYIQQGREHEAFELVEKMQQNNVEPNLVTYVHVLQACSSIGALEKGMLAHACIIENGFKLDVLVGSTLIDMYAKSGSLQDAHKVFGRLPKRDVVTWTTLIAGYAQHDEEHAWISLQLYKQMQLEGIQPNNVAYLSILKACAIVAALEHGKQVHQNIIESGLDGDILVSSSLIDMYLKCGSLEDACQLFNKFSRRNVVTWSSLIAGHAELGRGQEALQLFQEMQQEGVEPDPITFVCILKACSTVAALEQGKLIHGHVIERGFEMDVYIGSTLIHMYSKCGSQHDAVAVFDRLPSRSVVIFNALITGYAQHNNYLLASECLKDMQQAGCKPNDVTYLSLLSACSNLSLVAEGCHLFKSMREEHAIIQTLDHYNTLVDILGHAGCLCESEDFLETMPFKANLVGWIALLSSCRIHGNVDIGRHCFDQVVNIEPRNGAGYMLMSNIYSLAGFQESAEKVEQLRRFVNGWKKPGKSFIEIDNQVHVFVVGEHTHPRSQDIYAKLEDLSTKMRREGSLPCLNADPRAGDDMRDGLCGHSEKLAVGFGLISTPQGKTLRVLKNLRMCIDCHTVIMFISRIEARKIILIDAFCVHEFQDGACTCKSYYYKDIHFSNC